MHVAIDPHRCSGCGICASICADTFGMGDDLKAHVLESELDREHEGCAKMAVVDCPETAIVMH